MEESDRINILLKEYDALRAEILQRMSHRFTFISFAGAVMAYALFNVTSLNSYQIFSIILALIFLFGVWMQLGQLIKRCSDRIAEIENDINNKAGEELLKWEKNNLGSTVFHAVHKNTFR